MKLASTTPAPTPGGLTAEALMEVIRSLRSDLDAATAAGGSLRRRKLPRVGLRLKVTILNDDDATPAVVRVRNLSPRGLGFVHTAPLPVGGEFLVELPCERGGSVHLAGRVERCRPIDARLWDVGGSLRLDVPRQEIEARLRRAGTAGL